MKLKKTILGMALASAMGIAGSAEAGIVTATWSGAFTLLSPNGSVVLNPDTIGCVTGMLDTGGTSCIRTAVGGSLQWDTTSGAGYINNTPFSFFGAGLLDGGINPIVGIGDGSSGPASLILGNMEINWNGSYSIPGSIVLDASGFFGLLNGFLSVGQTITGGGASPASDNSQVDGIAHPIGPALMASTTFNTTNIGAIALGTVPSGTLPLINDTVVDSTNGDIGIGGSPMPTAPFKGYNANYDFLSMTITSCTSDICAPSPVPIPAAVWLFGSGLLGLIGAARRKAR